MTAPEEEYRMGSSGGQPVRVAYFITAPFLGGVHVGLRNILRELDRRKFTPLVVQPEETGHLLSYFAEVEVSTATVRSRRLSRLGWAAPFDLLRAAWDLARLVRRQRIEILHSTAPRAAILGLLVKWATGVKFVWQIAILGVPAYVHFLARFADRAPCVSRAVYEEFGRRPNMQVIHNGPWTEGLRPEELLVRRRELRQQLGIAEDALVVGSIANLEYWKGIHILLEAFARVARQLPETYLVHLGGPAPGYEAYAGEIDAMYERLALGTRVRRLGFREDAYRYYPVFDLFVHVPVCEGKYGTTEAFGHSVAEAMGYRLPVIASRLGGPAEIVEEGVTGELVEAGNVGELAEKILALLADPVRRRRMGSAGYAHYRRYFAIEREVRDYESLYLQLIRTARPVPGQAVADVDGRKMPTPQQHARKTIRSWATQTRSRIRQAVETVRLFSNFPFVFSQRLGLSAPDSSTIVRMRNEIRYKIRSGRACGKDLYVVRETWLQGLHDRLLSTVVGDHSVVVDVGAYIGTFAVKAAKQGNSVRVYCYEPEPENFKLLQENIRLNQLDARVKADCLAVWTHPGITRLFVTGDNAATHSLFPRHFEQYGIPKVGECLVRCTTLQELFESQHIEACDLLKFDCEGAEYGILYNAPPECLAKIRSIALECHQIEGESIDRLKDFMTRAGFEVMQPIPERPDVLHAMRTERPGENCDRMFGRVSSAVRIGADASLGTDRPGSGGTGFHAYWRRVLAEEDSVASKGLREIELAPFARFLTRALLAKGSAPARVLEVGAGRATASRLLAGQYQGTFFALDIVPEAVVVARRAMGNGRQPPVHLIVADVHRAPFPAEFFDLVFSQGLIEHFEDPSHMFAAHLALVRPGGLLVISVPQKYNLFTLYKRWRMRRGQWPPGWETEYSARQLAALGRNFELEVCDVDGHGTFLRMVVHRLLKSILSRLVLTRLVRAIEEADSLLGKHLRARLCQNVIATFRKGMDPQATS